MNLQFLFPIVVLVVFVGCSGSYEVLSDKAPRSDGAISYGELNSRTSGQSVAVVLKSGERTEATDLSVLDDSTSFVNAADATRRVIGTSEIREVVVTSRPTGMLEGLWPGATIGAVIFAAMAEAKGGLWGFWFGKTAGAGAAEGAIIGGAAGVLIGLGRGHVDHYEFLQDSTASVVLNQVTNDEE